MALVPPVKVGGVAITGNGPVQCPICKRSWFVKVHRLQYKHGWLEKLKRLFLGDETRLLITAWGCINCRTILGSGDDIFGPETPFIEPGRRE